MLDIKFLRENIALVKDTLQQRGEEANIEKFIEYDQQRRNLLQEAEKLKHQRNVFSKNISDLNKKGQAQSEYLALLADIKKRFL